MLYRKVEPCIRRNKDKETHLRKVRFYFWVWALAPPKATENYYYTLTIPRGQLQEGRNYAQAQYDEVFRYHAMAQSLQVTKEEVMASVAATVAICSGVTSTGPNEWAKSLPLASTIGAVSSLGQYRSATA